MKKFFLMWMLSMVITISFAQFPSTAPTNGLVGYWPFSGNGSQSLQDTSINLTMAAWVKIDAWNNLVSLNMLLYYANQMIRPLHKYRMSLMSNAV